MKSRAYIFWKFAAVTLLSVVCPVLSSLAAAPGSSSRSSSSLTNEMPQSEFTLPANPREGRDPFFPNSMRPYEAVKEARAAKGGVMPGELVVKGIIATKNGGLAIINNHPFGEDETGIVITKDGRRLEVHCVAIDPGSGTVTVEAAGSRVVLRFSPNTLNNNE